MKVSKKMTLPHVRLQQTQLGAYHSTKNFEIFETGTNGTEISWEKFQKIRKLLNFRKANHSTENSGIKVKWKGNFHEKKFENLGIPHEVILFFGIYAKFQLTTQRELVLLAVITASWTETRI